jgi:hypothetical protein
MLRFRVGVRVSARVRVRFPPIKNRSTYVGSLKLCGISDNAVHRAACLFANPIIQRNENCCARP